MTPEDEKLINDLHELSANVKARLGYQLYPIAGQAIDRIKALSAEVGLYKRGNASLKETIRICGDNNRDLLAERDALKAEAEAQKAEVERDIYRKSLEVLSHSKIHGYVETPGELMTTTCYAAEALRKAVLAQAGSGAAQCGGDDCFSDCWDSGRGCMKKPAAHGGAQG